MNITVKAYDIVWEVSGNYSKPSRGARERGSGQQLEPDEPAGFEVETIALSAAPAIGLEDHLSQSTIEAIQEAADEWARNYAAGD